MNKEKKDINEENINSAQDKKDTEKNKSAEDRNKEEQDTAVEVDIENLSDAEQKLKKQLDETEERMNEIKEENEKLNDKFTRLAAEFNNYKKRKKKEEQQRLKYEGKTILKELLPVFDDIDRAVEHQDSEEKKQKNDAAESDGGGLKMIYKKLHKILNDLGVVKYDAVGEEFDPELHHAIMTKEDEEHESNIVLEEIEKGYKYKDRVLRYSKVIVSK